MNQELMTLDFCRMAWMYHNTKDAVSEFSKK